LEKTLFISDQVQQDSNSLDFNNSFSTISDTLLLIPKLIELLLTYGATVTTTRSNIFSILGPIYLQRTDLTLIDRPQHIVILYISAELVEKCGLVERIHFPDGEESVHFILDRLESNNAMMDSLAEMFRCFALA